MIWQQESSLEASLCNTKEDYWTSFWFVESLDSLLETTKEKGKNTLVESPGKLVRKGLWGKAYRKGLSFEENWLSVPRQRRQNVIAQFVARSKGYKVQGQIGVTRTYPTQCDHDR